MKPGRKPCLTGDDIALAMELRTEGCSWENIAIGLGAFSGEGLRTAVKFAKRGGYRKTPPAVRSRIREAGVQERAREVLAGDTQTPALYGSQTLSWMEAS